MQAQAGDHVVVKGHRVGGPNRTGQVLEARGPSDHGPFLVRWDDDGHVTLLFPGNDAIVEHVHHDDPRLPQLVG